MLRTPWTESRAIKGTVISASRSSGGVPGTTIIRGSRWAAFVSTGSRCFAAQPARPTPNSILLRMISSAQRSRASTGTSSVWASFASKMLRVSYGISSARVSAIRSSSVSRACSERTWWKTSASRRYESTRSRPSGRPFSVAERPPKGGMESSAGAPSTQFIFGQRRNYLTPRPGDLRWAQSRGSSAVHGRVAHTPDAAVLVAEQCGGAAAWVELRGRLDDEHELCPPRRQCVPDRLESAGDRGDVPRPEVADGGSAIGEVVEVGVGPNGENLLARASVRA